MEKTTFADKEVVAFITKNFYAYQVDGDSPKGKLLGEKYAVQAYPTINLLNASGQLVYKAIGYKTPDQFVRNVQFGITESSSPTNLVRLEARYQQKPDDLSALKALITKRRYLDLNNSDLIDTLLTRLPADSLAMPTTLKLLMFCFTGGSDLTTVRSKAFALLRTHEYSAKANQDEPTDYGQALFNRANRSITVAEETKDLALFEDAIGMYLKLNPHATAVEGLKREKFLHQMGFYNKVGHIDKMVKASVSFCEDSLMRLGEEGINRFAARCVSRGVVIDESLPYDRKLALCRQDIINNMAHDLNQGAWGFYERITDKALLNQAISWSRQSLAFVEEANYLDTLAHLLYKIGQHEEAILYQAKAVELAKLKREDSLAYQKALEQIKAKSLKP